MILVGRYSTVNVGCCWEYRIRCDVDRPDDFSGDHSWINGPEGSPSQKWQSVEENGDHDGYVERWDSLFLVSGTLAATVFICYS
jgi:hypothetical protein